MQIYGAPPGAPAGRLAAREAPFHSLIASADEVPNSRAVPSYRGEGSGGGDSDSEELARQPHFQLGLAREFLVIGAAGGAPLLSAHRLDVQRAWTRVKQLHELKEVVDVLLVGCNRGGVIARLEGLRLFVPGKNLAESRRPARGGAAPRDSAAAPDAASSGSSAAQTELAATASLASLVGSCIPVLVTEVDEATDHLLGSEQAAIEALAQAKIRPGALVSGYVRKLTEFGAFVGIDDTRVSGLLHISEARPSRV